MLVRDFDENKLAADTDRHRETTYKHYYGCISSQNWGHIASARRNGLCAPEKPMASDKSSLPTKSRWVHIIVYGLGEDFGTVGTLLSGSGLFLQHPDPHLQDGNVTYDNPHYLTRPGAEIAIPEYAGSTPATGQRRSNPTYMWNKSITFSGLLKGRIVTPRWSQACDWRQP